MPCSVTRVIRRWLPGLVAGCAAVGLGACATPQRIYSTDPVDRAGQPLPWELVHSVELESGQTVRLPDGRLLRLEGDRLVVGDAADAAARRAPGVLPAGESASWPLADVRRVEILAPGARRQAIDVCTPDDLWEQEREPRVESVELRDGTRLELDSRSRGPQLDLGGAAVKLVLTDGSEQRVPASDVKRLVVTRGGLLASTLRSPATWLVTGATAGILVLISSTHDDANDAVK